MEVEIKKSPTKLQTLDFMETNILLKTPPKRKSSTKSPEQSLKIIKEERQSSARGSLSDQWALLVMFLIMKVNLGRKPTDSEFASKLADRNIPIKTVRATNVLLKKFNDKGAISVFFPLLYLF